MRLKKIKDHALIKLKKLLTDNLPLPSEAHGYLWDDKNGELLLSYCMSHRIKVTNRIFDEFCKWKDDHPSEKISIADIKKITRK